MLRRGLTECGFRVFTPAETRSPIMSFYIGGAAEAATKALDAAGVKVSVQNGDRTDAYGGSGAPPPRARVGVSLFNNAADIPRMPSAPQARPAALQPCGGTR